MREVPILLLSINLYKHTLLFLSVGQNKKRNKRCCRKTDHSTRKEYFERDTYPQKLHRMLINVQLALGHLKKSN